MAGRASKEKGKTFEREICKFLSDTLGGNFMRVPHSGAFIGGSNAFRKSSMDSNQVRQSKGDIVPPDELNKLVIEAKNYADIGFHMILNGSDCQQLDAWIEQTEEPADEGDICFTIFKITRRGSWVVFRESMKENFDLDGYSRYNAKNKEWYLITEMESFFKKNAESVKRLCSSEKDKS